MPLPHRTSSDQQTRSGRLIVLPPPQLLMKMLPACCLPVCGGLAEKSTSMCTCPFAVRRPVVWHAASSATVQQGSALFWRRPSHSGRAAAVGACSPLKLQGCHLQLTSWQHRACVSVRCTCCTVHRVGSSAWYVVAKHLV